jgi:hypothetical protein
MDGLHHQLEDWIEDLARLLGIAVGEQLHRALEVGEQDSDLLALTFEGGLGREDFLGEVLRGVGRGRSRRYAYLPVAGTGSERLAALLAELVCRRVRRAAGRTDDIKLRPALRAEVSV